VISLIKFCSLIFVEVASVIPPGIVDYVELILGSEDKLVEQKRLPGENEVRTNSVLFHLLFVSNNLWIFVVTFCFAHQIGMVAWKMTLKTPEYPEGRSVVVIANDLTHQIGSFGPEEDRLFLAASQYARRNAIPRVYLAANSGARIGLANEIKHLFKVAWEDPQEPDKVDSQHCPKYISIFNPNKRYFYFFLGVQVPLLDSRRLQEGVSHELCES
jgi:acetyl-CoA carboxylase/biotin carboxylase 1